MNKAVFLDRDGVIIEDTHLITSLDDITVLEGVEDAISKLRDSGFLLFLVTNQTVVARGLLTYNQTWDLNQQILKKISYKNPNAVLDKVFLCPHHPHAQVEEFRVSCSCRKPKPGMLLQAANEFDIDLSLSYMVGDRVSDLIAGNLAGCRTIWLRTGRDMENIINTDLADDLLENNKPNFEACSLTQAAEWILRGAKEL